MAEDIALRSVTPEDEPFLREVYISTRMEELAVTGWPDEQKRAFLHSQFTAQQHHYQTHYTDTAYDVILVNGTPAGRLYVAQWPEETRIVDIALLPEFRSQGIGTGLITSLAVEATARGVPVTIHVEIFNPARRLYDRLGFRQIEDKGVYILMELPAGTGVVGSR